jgi:hypothetical protein
MYASDFGTSVATNEPITGDSAARLFTMRAPREANRRSFA